MERQYTGTLSDAQIRDYCQGKRLITKNFNRNNIKQCCYELRASNRYFVCGANLQQACDATQYGYILIKPQQSIVVVTMESLSLPNDILGRILTKGKLFSIGLQPVNTYADPGFSGPLGIVLYNSSTNFIKIPIGKEIAKLEFSKLYAPVEQPYDGQHGGDLDNWIYPANMILSEEERKRDRRIESNGKEVERAYGQDLGLLYKKLEVTSHFIIPALIIYFVLMLILIAILSDVGAFDTFFSICVGLASNLIVAFVTYFYTRRR